MDVYPFDRNLAVSDIAQLMQHKYTVSTGLPLGFFASLALVKPHCDLQTVLVCVAWSHLLELPVFIACCLRALTCLPTVKTLITCL